LTGEQRSHKIVTAMSWRTLLLFLHIMFALAGFGPTFAFPFIGAAGGKEREHANFALRTTELISKRLVIPMSIGILVTGLILIWVAGWNLLRSEWLLIALVLYLIALGYSGLVQNPTAARMVELTSRPPGGEASGTPPPGPPPGGPPPEMLRLVKRMQRGGIFLTLLLVAIVLLMVWKPGGEL
jgi:uncharacterized membrane protein